MKFAVRKTMKVSEPATESFHSRMACLTALEAVQVLAPLAAGPDECLPAAGAKLRPHGLGGAALVQTQLLRLDDQSLRSRDRVQCVLQQLPFIPPGAPPRRRSTRTASPSACPGRRRGGPMPQTTGDALVMARPVPSIPFGCLHPILVPGRNWASTVPVPPVRGSK